MQSQNPTPGEIPKEFDLANFQATFPSSLTSLSLGDLSINLHALGVANLTRRGLFFEQKIPALRSSFNIFSGRSQTILGFRHRPGISDSNQRIDGGSIALSPFSKGLNLRLFFLQGENAKEEGLNFGGVPRGTKGTTYGLNFLSQAWNGQLKQEGFTSWSDFDFNASDNFSGNTDSAQPAGILLDPAGTTLKGTAAKFTLQL